MQYEEVAGHIEALVRELKADERAKGLLESLRLLEKASLKGLLRRVITKIFNDLQIKGWCSEFAARNAPGREAGAPAVG